MLTPEQQKIEAELTAARAEAIGWAKSNVDFFRNAHGIYQTLNQITFHEFGHEQELDDIVVNEFFQHQSTGRFLCVGAANGIDQTRSLLQKGWSGVYCEPDPMALSTGGHGLLRATENYRDQTVIVNAAITAQGAVSDFYINKIIALSTTKESWSKPGAIHVIIHTMGFDQLLDHVGEDFDYVQLDTEGNDAELIQSIDWSKRLPNCKMICVELGIEKWKQLLNQGYIISHVTQYNVYFTRLETA